MSLVEYNSKYEAIIEALLLQNYCVVDDFFSIEEAQQLRNSLFEKQESLRFRKAAIGNQENKQIIKSIRGDFISWINEHEVNTTEKMFFNKIDDFINYINRTCFLGIKEKEFHYALYPEGAFYKRHLDTFQNDVKRKLSMVCYLNEENWSVTDGGALVIYKSDQEISILPTQGRVVIFESQLLEHEVKPAKRERLSITGWLKR